VFEIWVRTFLSFGVAALAGFVILFRPKDDKAREWAFGVLGLLLGYWLAP
jgi:hypothetical protein